ncbi:hypothetical protein Tco_0723906 [Tanacetum coccineum]
MLGPGRYSQWRSRFLRYIDTKANGAYLRKCIFDGPYKLTSVLNKELFFLLLTGIGDEIYSTVDAATLLMNVDHPIEKTTTGLYKPTNNNLRTSSDSRNKTKDTTPRYNNDNQSGQFGNQRTMTVAGAREIVGSQRTRMKRLMNRIEAHTFFMAKIQEVLPEESSSTDQPLEQKDDSNVTLDSSNICKNDNQVDQNAAECVDERAALANLIANLTLDTEGNKTILSHTEKQMPSLTQRTEGAELTLM